MIEENSFLIIKIFQYLVISIFIGAIYLRKKFILKEEKFLENLFIFFILGCGFKLFGLSIFDEIIIIIIFPLILYQIIKYKNIDYIKYIKKNYLFLLIIGYLIFKLFSNLDTENYINYLRFFLIYIFVLLLSIYLFLYKKKITFDYNLILNIGMIYFSIFLILSYITDIYFINYNIDLSVIWNNFRTYQVDKFVFQNIYWQGVSSSNFAFLPFIIFYIIKKDQISKKELIFLSMVSLTAVYWHSMQLIAILILLYIFLIFKNFKNVKNISFSILLTFIFLSIISSTLIKQENKNLNFFKKNEVNFKNYSNQFKNLFQITSNLFSMNKDKNFEKDKLQSYTIIEEKKDDFYFIGLNKKIVIKNISLQDKLVPILLSLKKTRDMHSVIYGEGFRSYRNSVPILWSQNLNYFRYISKEDTLVKKEELLNTQNKKKNVENKVLPTTECKKDLITDLYSCISLLNYSIYNSPTTIIATIYDYGYLFILLVLFFIFNKISKSTNFKFEMLFIYSVIFLFAFTTDLTDCALFYVLLIFTPYLLNNEKIYFKHLS